MKKLLSLMVSILVFVIMGCSDSGESPTGGNNNGGNTDPTFTNLSSLLQSAGCSSASCHGGNPPTGGYSMANYDNIVNDNGDHGSAVVSGQGSISNLYLKVTNNPPFGSRMPLIGDTLTSAQQQLIKDWIDQGALDN